MKISTNLTEIKELFARHLGINVSELELTIESEDVPATSNDDGGWIINTQTSPVHPTTLHARDEIEVVMSNGAHDQNIAMAWITSWDTTTKQQRHIVKYRKVNK